MSDTKWYLKDDPDNLAKARAVWVKCECEMQYEGPLRLPVGKKLNHDCGVHGASPTGIAKRSSLAPPKT